MTETERDVYELLGKGYCCAQVMVAMGLEHLGDDNDQLLQSVAGLCGGMKSGMVCGVLTGAACLMSLLDFESREDTLPELTKWFRETYTEKFGGYECAEIVNDNPENKLTRCPGIMVETFEKCREIMAGRGIYI